MHWYGFRLGRWHVTWYDLWTKQFCFEVASEGAPWRNRLTRRGRNVGSSSPTKESRCQL